MDAACRVTLPGGLDPTALPLMVAAAREALAPIRELHKPCAEPDYPDEPYCKTCGHYDGSFVDFTHQPWPCDTARLIYTSSELEVGA